MAKTIVHILVALIGAKTFVTLIQCKDGTTNTTLPSNQCPPDLFEEIRDSEGFREHRTNFTLCLACVEGCTNATCIAVYKQGEKYINCTNNNTVLPSDVKVVSRNEDDCSKWTGAADDFFQTMTLKHIRFYKAVRVLNETDRSILVANRLPGTTNTTLPSSQCPPHLFEEIRNSEVFREHRTNFTLCLACVEDGTNTCIAVYKQGEKYISCTNNNTTDLPPNVKVVNRNEDDCSRWSELPYRIEKYEKMALLSIRFDKANRGLNKTEENWMHTLAKI